MVTGELESERGDGGRTGSKESGSPACSVEVGFGFSAGRDRTNSSRGLESKLTCYCVLLVTQVDFKIRTIELEGKTVKLQIVSSKQERPPSLPFLARSPSCFPSLLRER